MEVAIYLLLLFRLDKNTALRSEAFSIIRKNHFVLIVQGKHWFVQKVVDVGCEHAKVNDKIITNTDHEPAVYAGWLPAVARLRNGSAGQVGSVALI